MICRIEVPSTSATVNTRVTPAAAAQEAALHEAALRYPGALDDIQLFLAGSSTAAISSAPTVTAALRSMTSRETGSPHRTRALVSPSPGMTFSATAPPATSEPTSPATAVTATSPAALYALRISPPDNEYG